MAPSYRRLVPGIVSFHLLFPRLSELQTHVLGVEGLFFFVSTGEQMHDVGLSEVWVWGRQRD